LIFVFINFLSCPVFYQNVPFFKLWEPYINPASNKISIKLPLCLIDSAPRHEDIWGSGGIAPTLTSELKGDERSASRPGRFTSGDIAPGTHWRGGRVGHRAGLDAMKGFAPDGNRTPATQPVPTELSRLLIKLINDY
jgi:hypothetical protein